MLNGDFVSVLHGKEVVGEEAFVDDGFLFADGGEEGVVGTDGLQAVGRSVDHWVVGGQCVYLQHGVIG